VGHSQLNGLDAGEVAKMSRARVAVDMVNGWQPAGWQATGFDIYRLGVGSEHAS
jgi:hypothetical protein